MGVSIPCVLIQKHRIVSRPEPRSVLIAGLRLLSVLQLPNLRSRSTQGLEKEPLGFFLLLKRSPVLMEQLKAREEANLAIFRILEQKLRDFRDNEAERRAVMTARQARIEKDPDLEEHV